MKKILELISTFAIMTTGLATTISCGITLVNNEAPRITSIKDLEVVVDYQPGITTVAEVKQAASTALKKIALGTELFDDYTIETTLWTDDLGDQSHLILKPGFVRVEATPNSRFFIDGFKMWVLIDVVEQLNQHYPNLLRKGTRRQAEETKPVVLAAIARLAPEAKLDTDFYFDKEFDESKGWKLTFNMNQGIAKYYINYEFKIVF